MNFSKEVWNACVNFSIPLVYASSAATYGLGEHGYKDDHNVIPKLTPLNPYGDSKNDFDLWVLQQKVFPPFWAGLKFFNVYGPNEITDGDYATVIGVWRRQIRRGEPITIIGDGKQRRDFTYIDNVIQANVLSMITENEEAINTVYNVAFGERNTLKDLVELLKKSLTEFDSKIKDIQVIYGPNRVGDIPHSLASIDKAKKLLAYNPQFSLEKGLKEAVNWYWNNL